MRLVFMGTPEFAVSSLVRLAESSHQLIGVVTAPDRPQGRGLTMQASPVKQMAETLCLPVVQPEKVDDPAFLETLKSWQADCFVVVGFRILPPVVFEMPSRGSFNLHASLLPKYRGAAPIQWAIIHGERETGVTTFMLHKQVDRGDILFQVRTPIGNDETAGELHDRLSQIGADLVVRTVNAIDDGRIHPVPQIGEPISAPKITPELGHIQWQNSGESIRNLIRGLSPVPGAYGTIKGKRLKIFKASVIKENVKRKYPAGTILEASGSKFWIQTGEGILAVKDCQLQGRKRLCVDHFLCGTNYQPGDRFDTQEIKRC